MKRTLAPLIVVVLVLLTLAGSASAAPTSQPDVSATVTAALAQSGQARVIIALRDTTALKAPLADRAKTVGQAQAALLARLSPADFQLYRQYSFVPALAGTVNAKSLAALQSHPNVRAITLAEPIQPHLGQSVVALGANTVHTTLGLTGQGVRVAFIDTGIDVNHPDLNDDIVAQKCFTAGECRPGATFQSDNAQDENGHGTHVAGIISGKGTTAPKGFAPDAELVAVRVVGQETGADLADVVAGLDWILGQAALNIRIVNMSFGTYSLYASQCDTQYPALADALALLHAAGVTLFASSGNEGSSTGITAPACNSHVIAVGATFDGALGREPDAGTYQSLFEGSWPTCFDAITSLQTVACFSNSNALVDMVAPGSRITATALGGGQVTAIGTSAAAPTAAGIAALMLQANPALTPNQIETILKTTGASVTDAKNGQQFPLINALAAVQAVQALQSVTGQLQLQGRSNHAGIRFQLGAYETLTATDGSFNLLVPPGTYQASASYAGYLPSQRQVVIGSSSVAVPLAQLLGGDTNNSQSINIFDLVLIGAQYDQFIPPGNPAADINADGQVGIIDLTMVGVNFDRESFQPWTASGSYKRATDCRWTRQGCPGLVMDAPAKVIKGEEFWVAVRLTGGAAVAGLDVTLDFDPATARPVTATQLGGWFDADHTFVARNTQDSVRGQLRLVATRLGQTAPVNADGVLFTTRFRALRDGTLAFKLSDPHLVTME